MSSIEQLLEESHARVELLSTLGPDRTVRYRLFAPDLNEARWNVFDTFAKRTVGLGETYLSALDSAIATITRDRRGEKRLQALPVSGLRAITS